MDKDEEGNHSLIARWDTCCRVKPMHLKPDGLLPPLFVLGWKWEEVSVDFIVRVPPTQKGFDSIWVIVECLTKSTHFILVKTYYRLHQYAELYVSHIVRLHGVPRTIVSDRGPPVYCTFLGTFAQGVRHQLS
jgi:hypothetical protein